MELNFKDVKGIPACQEAQIHRKEDFRQGSGLRFSEIKMNAREAHEIVYSYPKGDKKNSIN